MITSGDNLPQRVKDTVADMVTVFANDYLSVSHK